MYYRIKKSRINNFCLIISIVLLSMLNTGGCGGSGSEGNNDNGDGSNGIDIDNLQTEPYLSGFNRPVFLTHPGDGSGRIFVVEKGGKVIEVNQVEGTRREFLNIGERVRDDGFEQGLLSIAFHPSFEINGRFFVYYTDNSGDSIISEFLTNEQSGLADENSEKILLTIPQPEETHNGGQLQFGNNGYLYIGTGDGGGVGDPRGNAQNLDTLLGKLLRIDIDSGDNYSIPEDNPFVGDENARDEIWAFGLRHPWRFSFDSETHDMYIADVGEAEWEEVNFQPASSMGGENYGWKYMEGTHEFRPPDDFDPSELVMPVAEYSHDVGCSVTGGYVYRGDSYNALEGIYFFGDFCSGNIWGLKRSDDNEWSFKELIETDLAITSFGIDEDNEIYVMGLNSGEIHRIVVSE